MTHQRSTPRCSGGVSRRREDRGARYLEAVALGSCGDQSPSCVSEAREILLLIVEKRRIAPPYIAEFHLQVVAEYALAPALLGL
jgi:hypothetical protein